MARNTSAICLSEKQMMLSADDNFETLLSGYIAPFFILFGFTGNLINLTILMAPSMKTRSNQLLACLAVADMLFLLTMLLNCFAKYEYFVRSNTFRAFFFKLQTPSLAMTNWFSMTAIWLILTICLERLIGIRYPLSVRNYRSKHTLAIIFGIVTTTLLLTVYWYFSYYCNTQYFCNGTQLHGYCFPVDAEWPHNKTNPYSSLQRMYVRWSHKINAIFGIFIPTVIIVISNVMLIYTLRQRKEFIAVSTGYGNSTKKNSNGTSDRTASQGAAQLKLEQRVAFTVCAIVSSFIITQAPSACISLMAGFLQHSDPVYLKRTQSITAFMVLVGKSLNFVLFCLSSANFRQKLIKMTKERLCHENRFSNSDKKRIRSYSLNSSTSPTIYTQIHGSPLSRQTRAHSTVTSTLL